jgi:DNA polymerase I-like protein with 3'-5' exonuclease and polymerase domains
MSYISVKRCVGWISQSTAGLVMYLLERCYALVIPRDVSQLWSRAASQENQGAVPCYDIADAGPRNRYCCLGEGVTIVHNCAYGMGKKKLASSLGLDDEQANELMNKYHEAVPYVSSLSRLCQEKAKKSGFINTLSGRRSHFDLWGPRQYSAGLIPKSKEEALKEWGPPVNRYFVHKALNRLIQGGSADMVKMAMLKAYRLGFVPHVTMHDELDYSVSSDEEIRKIEQCMLTAYDLTVPMKVDIEVGPSWGEVELI